MFIDLGKYSRKDFSNFLQIATQAETAGYPLPEPVVQTVQAAHDDMLNALDAGKPKVKAKTLTIYKNGGICSVHATLLQLRPCGAGYFCPSCHDDLYGI